MTRDQHLAEIFKVTRAKILKIEEDIPDSNKEEKLIHIIAQAVVDAYDVLSCPEDFDDEGEE